MLDVKAGSHRSSDWTSSRIRGRASWDKRAGPVGSRLCDDVFPPTHAYVRPCAGLQMVRLSHSKITTARETMTAPTTQDTSEHFQKKTTMALTTDDAATPSMNVEQEEEESCWVPLAEEETVQSSQQTAQATIAGPMPDSSTPSAPTNNRPPPRREGLEMISARLDSKIRLKQGLVDHPLDRGWRLFLQHFCREIWQLDVHLQLGIVLVVIGTILLTITWALSFHWFRPQTIILFIVFGVSFYYLAPPDVERKLESFFRLLVNPDKAFELADYADPAIMRRLFVIILLLPTFLELRTFGFLSEAMAESGFRSNVSVGVLLGAFLAYQFKVQQATPRQSIQRGIHVLYGFALFFSLWRVDLWRLPALAGPFFLATGTLLLSNRDEDMNWLSRALRHALRLTLRDVLASVGESVREDEMLQLAMLRWIVDYWSYQPHAAQSSASSSTANQTARPTESRPTTDIVATRNSQPLQEVQQRRDLQWEELQPMLDMTTDQMNEEVPAHQPGGSFSEQQSSSRRSQSWSDSSQQDNDSLQNLRYMLHTLDVDDRARPAVMKYKHVVESFPPPRSNAVFLSMIRRCPAMLMLFFRYVTGSDLALASTATLLPFAVMEAFRVLHWAEACQRALESGVRNQVNEEAVRSQSRSSPFISLPPDMDPMCILLSGDSYAPTYPPPLLQVWINICSSVYALETGLTAARCVQTTAVAADFASNIISLAQFGVEVTQFGWVHGITVLARELMHIHATQSASEAKYTSAAVNAIRNGQIVARNVKALSEEEGGNPVVDPIVGVLTAIVGRGWLWGREEEAQLESTVTIEELPSDETPSVPKEPKLLTKESADAKDQSDSESRRDPTEATTDRSEPLADNEDRLDTLVVASTEFLSELNQEAEDTILTDVAPSVIEDESRAGELKSSTIDPAPESSDVARNDNEFDMDLSELMELIADTFEQGLIVESEKNAFMETLLVSGTEEHQKPSRATVEQMERSLRELMESSRNEEEPCAKQQESEPPIMHPEQGDAGEPVSAANTEQADDSDEWRPLSLQPQEVARQDSEELALPNDSASVAVARSAIAPQSVESSVGTPDLQTNTTSVRSSGNQEDEKGDDWLKWVGGSIAVFGAVAGGIAIANNASQREDDNSSRRTTTANQSTVFIEELEDDDETADEWVAVAASQSDD